MTLLVIVCTEQTVCNMTLLMVVCTEQTVCNMTSLVVVCTEQTVCKLGFIVGSLHGKDRMWTMTYWLLFV